MEEHFRAKEAFVANINFSLLTSNSVFMSIFLELIRLEDLARLIHGLLVVLIVLLNYILANVTISLLLTVLSNVACAYLLLVFVLSPLLHLKVASRLCLSYVIV